MDIRRYHIAGSATPVTSQIWPDALECVLFVFLRFILMISSIFRRSVAGFLAFSLLLPSSGLAATGTITDVMPDDVTLYGQVDLTQFTPKNLIDTLVKLAVGELNSVGLESDTDDDAATAKKRASLAMDIMTGGVFATGMRAGASPNGLQNYFVSTINDLQWTSYLELNGKNLEKKIYTTHEYYVEKSADAKALARVNQFFIGADSEKSMKSLFDKVDKGEVLSNDKDYQATVGSGGAGLFSGYSDLSSALDSVKKIVGDDANDAKQTIFDVAQHLGYALKQFAGGIELSTIVTRDAAVKDSIYTPSPFMPMLYQYATAQHPLLYLEAANLAKSVAQSQSVAEFDLGEELDLNSKEQDLNFEKDIVSLITKGYSFTVEKGSGTFLPSFTFMADVKDTTEAMRMGLKKVYDSLVSEELPEGVAVSGPALGGLYDFSVSFTPDEEFWYEFEEYLPRMSTTFSLVVNLTSDGVLVVSTKPNVMKSYKTGMDITEFGDIGKRTDVSGLFSLNLSDVMSIAKEAVQTYYSSLDEEFRPYMDVTTALNAIDQIFSPWQRVSASATATDTTGSAMVKFFFDPRVYESAYWEGVVKAVGTLDKSSDQYGRITGKFSDVPRDQWYAHDVKNLKARGVVKGYYDNSFKPEQLVTRIEFLAMLYRGVYGDAPSSFSMEDGSMEGGSLEDELVGGSDPRFIDVEPFEWYYDILNDSAKKGLVKGYANNTFRPGALITRSEAVAMIARFYEYNNDTEFFVDLPWRDDRAFADVAENAWFNKAVHDAYMLGIVDGTPVGRFEPNRNLNRAEAAKLISRLLRKKVG